MIGSRQIQEERNGIMFAREILAQNFADGQV